MISITTALTIATLLTLVGLVAACIRLILGPSRADRVVALDLITILLVAIAAQLSLRYEEAAYLDVGLAIALIGFLATVAFARYIENAPLPTAVSSSESTDLHHPDKPDDADSADARSTHGVSS